MILRGAFWVGLVWLCAPHMPGPAVADANAACRTQACAAESAQDDTGMRDAVLQRLADLKAEIRDGSNSRLVNYALAAGERVQQMARLLPERAIAAGASR